MLNVRFNYIFFFFFSCLCIAQQEALVEIITGDEAKEVIQLKIDSFLIANEKKMSQKQLADCYHDVGNKWYYEQWRNSGEENTIENAIFYTQKALEIKSRLKNLEKGSLDQTYFNLGIFYYLKGEVYNAIETYSIIADNGTDVGLIQDARLELGFLYLTTGDFYKALNQFSEIISFNDVSNLSGSYSSLMIDAQILRAETFAAMGVKEFSNEIRLNLKKADSLIDHFKETYKQFRRRIDNLEGNRLLEIGNYELAIVKHKEVLEDSMDLEPIDVARLHNNIGYSQLKLKNFDGARKSLHKAIFLVDSYSLPFENLGDLDLDQNNFEKALFNYQKAIVLVTDKKKNVDFKELPAIQNLELATEKIFLLGHIIAKANGWLKFYEYDKNQDHLTHALETFEVADQLVDIIRSESTEYQSKLFWREKGASLYTKAVEVCYLLDKPERAYYFMERNKALLLLEDISNEQAKHIAKLPNAMAEREFEFKRAIFLSENALKNFESIAPDSLNQVKQRVYKSKQIYNTFMDSLAKAFPEYASIKRKVDVLPYPKFISSYISEDEVVLQYILNEEQGYGMMTAADRTHFFKLEDVDNLNKNIISLYGQLTDLATNRNKMADFHALSYQVFGKLVPETVYYAIQGKKLTLITDYSLQQIPFEAFVVSGDTDKYLIEDTEIRYAYSMSYLDAKRQIVNHPEKEFFGMAPVQFASLGLPELQFSEAEVGEAEKLFSGKLALNGEATKASFLENEAQYKIVHLSTHADVGEGSDPWIAFSDQKMFLDEIYATKNNAEMVVLSACNTSIGELKKGEGAMSLARGFFHSGAKSVISSLWSTNDKSSKEVMAAYYQGLDKGLTKSAAMRNAKMDYIDKYRGTSISPAYWSAIIVIGDTSPISSTGNDLSIWLWAILGILVLLVFYIIFKKRNALS